MTTLRNQAAADHSKGHCPVVSWKNFLTIEERCSQVAMTSRSHSEERKIDFPTPAPYSASLVALRNHFGGVDVIYRSN